MLLECKRCGSGFEVKSRQGSPLYCANCKKLNATDAAKLRRDKKYEEQGPVLLTCVDCGVVFEKQARKGPVPKRCPACMTDILRKRAQKGMTKRRAEHHEEHLATRRDYYSKNVKAEREIAKAWREDHPGYASEYAAAHPEEQAAYGAIQRATNPNHPRYPDWGGRGVEWRFESVAAFVEHIGPRPSDQHSLDRVCVNGHYEPGNVRWATAEEQAANRRLQDGTCWCHGKTLEALNKKPRRRRTK